jgi:cytochrome b-561
MVGLALLRLTIGASFTGYALPDDAFSVTATDIGFGIASSIPWAGPWLAQLFFGGHYPTEHSLPRLLSLHITWLPLSLMALVGLHLLILVKQKHTQPAYARRLAPGSILGVPLVPQQALMMGVVLLTYLSIVFALGGAYQAHPAEVFGPPQATTPEVKPDWYFLSLYGILQIVPSSWKLHVLGADFGPEFFGALLPPILMLAGMVALPLLDRRRERQHYAELPSAHPLRTGATLGLVTFFGMAALGGFHQQLGLGAGLMWALLILVPIATTLIVRQALAWALRRSQEKSAGR